MILTLKLCLPKYGKYVGSTYTVSCDVLAPCFLSCTCSYSKIAGRSVDRFYFCRTLRASSRPWGRGGSPSPEMAAGSGARRAGHHTITPHAHLNLPPITVNRRYCERIVRNLVRTSHTMLGCNFTDCRQITSSVGELCNVALYDRWRIFSHIWRYSR